MNQIILHTYIFISIIIAITDIYLALRAWKINKTTGKYLGYTCLGAAIVDISYLVSILNVPYFCMSLMSSIYFFSIDFTLFSLLLFTIFFVKGNVSSYGRVALRLGMLYCVYEAVVFIVNPFVEIAISYSKRDTIIAQYDYVMKPLYKMHLVFSYALIVIVIILMIRKMLMIPKEYRSQYSFVILGILLVVGVNAIFLFVPGENVYNLLDYSICGYSLAAFLLYWSCFIYSTHGMLNKLKTNIFENIGQGIVLFDYDNHLILHNDRADYFLGRERLSACDSMQKFLESYNLSADMTAEDLSYSLQCYVKTGNEERTLRCDVRKLENKSGRKLGQMFVFSDIALETDMLTGFQKWESFQRLAVEESDYFTFPIGVAICDINSLSIINSTSGKKAGDQKIKELADTLRKCFPERTYYVRGVDANLVALCSHSSEEEVSECALKVKSAFDGSIQYAVGVVKDADENVADVIQDVSVALRAKKLVDSKSIHSDMLASLIRALEECDSDTEHHVRRTQIMGAELGKRIELSDIQQSKLSLLCLLHDIGKISIPLEILNKPGKLTDDEWVIMKSHVEKGYEIANSNTELKQIAEEIRHHHERWDGKGYPDGLSRESIPILSRVIAVVDAYDAMTNDRAYRPAMSVTKALEELKRCAGTQFDPFIVSEFTQMIAEKHNNSEESDNTEVQETKTAERGQLSKPEELLRPEDPTSVHTVTFSRYLLDGSWNILSVDDNFEKLTGYTKEDIKSRTFNQMDLIAEEDRTEYLCITNANLARSTFVIQEHKLHRKDGTNIYVFCYGRMFYDSAVQEGRAEIFIADISTTYAMKVLTNEEQNKAEARLRTWENTYRTDSLTGLLNHAAYRSDVEEKLLSGSMNCIMLMMDVDKFKQYNDTYGHHNGDKYLVLVAQTLLSALRSDDYACRMGGDEFSAMLFFDKSVPEKVMRERAQQIFDKLNMTVKSAEGGTSISMGAVVVKSEASFNQLYEEADVALYSAKENGRSRLVITEHADKNK